MFKSTYKKPKLRFIILKFISALLLAVLAGFIFRTVFFDSYHVNNTYMSPTLIPGDRVLSSKISGYFNGGIMRAKKGKLITFKHPRIHNKVEIKRIAAVSGDHIKILKGYLYVNNKRQSRDLNPSLDTIFESSFLDPRIEFETFKIPGPGDTLFLENLEAREFHFAMALLKQEKPGLKFTYECQLMLNQKVVHSSDIAKIFKLSLDSAKNIDLNSMSWIDLSNLEIQLSNRFPKENISFKFSVDRNSRILEYFIVKNTNYFVIGDNSSLRYDSRYWGLVNETQITSKPLIIFWSNKPNHWFDINFDRLLKIMN